jgi:hypothetical protein
MDLDHELNYNKSKCMQVGPRDQERPRLYSRGSQIHKDFTTTNYCPQPS